MDELLLGLAPNLVDEVFDIIRRFKSYGFSILFIGQNLFRALGVTDRGHIVEIGKIGLADFSKALMRNKEVRRVYIGKKLIVK